MRKRLLIGSLALLLGWCDVALAQRSGGVLRIFHRDNPTSASILEEANASTVVAFMPVFNNLVMFDPAVAKNADDTIVPDLAESWTWNDDRTELSFKLRRGAKWHDGMPFTSSDVECTFNLLTNRARNRLRTNPRGSWFGNVNFVRAPTDFDVTIHLNRPQPSLLAMLASGFVPIYPCHVPLAQMRVKPVGTGPFKLESFNQFDRIRLVRNPDYWKAGRPYLDGIEFSVVASRSTALLSFVAGRYDMTFPSDVSMSQLRDVRRQSPRVMCEATAMNNNTNLMLNREAPPFDNPDVRRALMLTLDRRAFMDSLSDGSGVIGGHLQPAPEGRWGLPAEMLAKLPGYGADLEKNRTEARELMRKAGYGPDKLLPLKIFTRAVSLYRSPAAVLATQLQEIYFEPTLDVVETVHWFTRLQRRDFALAIETTGNAIDDPDQVFYETFACRSERNYNRYCNPEIERLFEAQSSELDVEKRRQLVWDLEARLLADSARPPLMWNRAATCWQPYVQGFVPQTNSSYNGFRFEDVWIDRR
ncbi:ABC transporter substrate-binding protein [Reyranella aquatilis]|uniref:ABC transporter substrate-binding protein n=1 Tax=Reyranella aquatilis TaxID=2035356 RepID=A0ABS8KXG5_9HYPH|nr:ABC transporter substrate-binding protein [Reyranella aquatilis]MCC8430755.1 ABC transporter substrate-binding protein [Reyranella aquatilis]